MGNRTAEKAKRDAKISIRQNVLRFYDGALATIRTETNYFSFDL